VPYGHDEDVPIFSENNLRNVQKVLKKAKLKCEDFEINLDRVEKNDFVFLDPPYTVTHNNNGFIAYNQRLFTWEDQQRLADAIAKINQKGAKFILTNAFHESVKDLYKGVGKQFEISRSSTITSQVGKRRRVSEYLITNTI
jgi:DNA adenine methylase